MPHDEFYRVPLSTAEALAALAVLRALARFGTDDPAVLGDIDASVLESAAERVEAEMPDFAVGKAAALSGELLSELRQLRGSGGAVSNLSPDESDSEDDGENPPFPVARARRLLQDAWDREVPVEIEYFVARRNEWTTRRVEIQNVRRDDGVWYVAGQCGMRRDYRNFRIDHIRSVRLLEGDAATEAEG
ncbi:MAG TPA: WYL domain-containing protein [Armatimonadaceae bacterium]|nr:WYL domain-containing protein [Armatimonadaceae bacterium]